MPVNRKIFKIPFHKGSQPQWLCPTCNTGLLKGVKSSFVRAETNKSNKEHSHIEWEPEWIRYSYACQFKCTNPACEEAVFNVGVGSVDSGLDYDDNGQPSGQTYFDIFQPRFFIPHLNIIRIPDKTPDSIKSSLHNSFELFFASPSASANYLRIALEQLLDHFKIKKFETVNGRKHIISLHKRISLVPSKLSEFKELFYAIKWLGNDASHIGGLVVDDVMDAYDIFESILDEVFDHKTKETKRLARKINKRKGV